MHGVLPTANSVATEATDTTTDKFVSDENWFAEMVGDVIGKTGAGTTLACLTGVDERYCWRYAAGTKPFAFFLRLLLRSERGGAVLAYIMDGSQVAWWRDHCGIARKAAMFDRIVEITERQ